MFRIVKVVHGFSFCSGKKYLNKQIRIKMKKILKSPERWSLGASADECSSSNEFFSLKLFFTAFFYSVSCLLCRSINEVFGSDAQRTRVCVEHRPSRVAARPSVFTPPQLPPPRGPRTLPHLCPAPPRPGLRPREGRYERWSNIVLHSNKTEQGL